MNKMGDSEKEAFKLGMVNGIMKKVEAVVPTQEGVEAVTPEDLSIGEG